MINFILNKNLITEKILAIIKPDFTESELIETNFKIWWKSKSGGMRLTSEGVSFFGKANIEYYNFNCNKTNLGRGVTLLKFDKYLAAPYFLSTRGNFVRIYDSRIASLIHLYGSIIDYVNTLDTQTRDLT